jgi:hypothetical protein
MTLSAAQGKLTVQAQWTVSKARSGLPNLPSNDSVKRTVSLSLGSSADQFQEMISTIVSIAAAATANVDIATALTNVVNDLAVPVTKVVLWLVELLSTSDKDANGNVLGTACSGITIGNHATQPFQFGMSAAATDTIHNGDFRAGSDHSAGLTVANGTVDTIKIVNNDAAVAAAVRITLFCR